MSYAEPVVMFAVSLGTVADALPAEMPRQQPSVVQMHALEDEIRKLPPAAIEETHHFADGIYGRELFIPAGTVLTGKMHRHSTLNLLIKGDITATTNEGVKRIQAPAIFVSPPMTKKVGFAHTDVIWVNVHPSSETDLAKLEAQFIVPDELALTDEDTQWLGQQ